MAVVLFGQGKRGLVMVLAGIWCTVDCEVLEVRYMVAFLVTGVVSGDHV